MEELKNIALQVLKSCKEQGIEVTPLRLVLLCYLAEVEYKRQTGKRLTVAEWVWDEEKILELLKGE